MTYLSLSAELIQKRSSGNRVFGKSVFCYHSIDSTNTFAVAHAKSYAEEGTIVTAELQTRGRGRGAKSWNAIEGENLTFSVVLRPKRGIETLTLISILSAVAVAKTIQELFGIEVEIKWPNDVRIQQKKVCGILLESSIISSSVDYLILGIGVNLNQDDFPTELESIATSLKKIFDTEINREDFFVLLLEKLDELYEKYQSGKDEIILKEWRTYAMMLGKNLTFTQNGTEHIGKAIDITNQGFLKVYSEERELILSQSEISNIRY